MDFWNFAKIGGWDLTQVNTVNALELQEYFTEEYEFVRFFSISLLSFSRFNVYDRGPLCHLSEDDIKAYYEAFRALAAEIQDPSSAIQIKLTPGRVMIFDNWRILHGRKGFTGKRIMTGCYLSRMEYLNTLRTVAGIKV